MRLSVEEAFQRYGDRVFSAAFSICRNREDADDAVQEKQVQGFWGECSKILAPE